MKTIIRYIAVTVLVAGLTVPGSGFDKSRQIGITLTGGIISNAHGGFFAPTHTMSDVMDMGTSFSLGVSYGVSEILRLEALVDFGFASLNNNVEAGMGPIMEQDPTYTIGPDPTYVMTGYKLQGVTHLNPALGIGDVISPFISFGAGIYTLSINDDGVLGDRIESPHNRMKNVSKTTFGLNAGLGVEVYVTPMLAIMARGKYDLLMTDDTERFGPDFRNQGFMSFDLGFSYYFSMF